MSCNLTEEEPACDSASPDSGPSQATQGDSRALSEASP